MKGARRRGGAAAAGAISRLAARRVAGEHSLELEREVWHTRGAEAQVLALGLSVAAATAAAATATAAARAERLVRAARAARPAAQEATARGGGVPRAGLAVRSHQQPWRIEGRCRRMVHPPLLARAVGRERGRGLEARDGDRQRLASIAERRSLVHPSSAGSSGVSHL